MWKTRIPMSLLKIVGQKLPLPQRSSLEKCLSTEEEEKEGFGFMDNGGDKAFCSRVYYFVCEQINQFLTTAKTKSKSSVALPSPTTACLVCSCFRNPHNFDMDYMIFNARTWSFLYACVYTRGFGTSAACQHKMCTLARQTQSFNDYFIFVVANPVAR